MTLPQRKHLRCKAYDYSQKGAYFITICTHKKECLFGDIAIRNAPVVGTGLDPSAPTSPFVPAQIPVKKILFVPHSYSGSE